MDNIVNNVIYDVVGRADIVVTHFDNRNDSVVVEFDVVDRPTGKTYSYAIARNVNNEVNVFDGDKNAECCGIDIDDPRVDLQRGATIVTVLENGVIHYLDVVHIVNIDDVVDVVNSIANIVKCKSDVAFVCSASKIVKGVRLVDYSIVTTNHERSIKNDISVINTSTINIDSVDDNGDGHHIMITMINDNDSMIKTTVTIDRQKTMIIKNINVYRDIVTLVSEDGIVNVKINDRDDFGKWCRLINIFKKE